MPKLGRPRRCGSPTGGSTVQSLRFPRDEYTAAQARRWALEHGFIAPEVDTTENQLRVRQFDPGNCRYVTHPLGDDVSSILEFPRNRPAMASSDSGISGWWLVPALMLGGVIGALVGGAFGIGISAVAICESTDEERQRMLAACPPRGTNG